MSSNVCVGVADGSSSLYNRARSRRTVVLVGVADAVRVRHVRTPLLYIFSSCCCTHETMRSCQPVLDSVSYHVTQSVALHRSCRAFSAIRTLAPHGAALNGRNRSSTTPAMTWISSNIYSDLQRTPSESTRLQAVSRQCWPAARQLRQPETVLKLKMLDSCQEVRPSPCWGPRCIWDVSAGDRVESTWPSHVASPVSSLAGQTAFTSRSGGSSSAGFRATHFCRAQEAKSCAVCRA